MEKADVMPPQTESQREINFKNQALVSKKSRERKMYTILCCLCAFISRFDFTYVLRDGNNHTSFCAFRICIFTK